MLTPGIYLSFRKDTEPASDRSVSLASKILILGLEIRSLRPVSLPVRHLLAVGPFGGVAL